MTLPNVIVAGVPKCGTTSLFRYLAHHPEVCTSTVKEVNYLLRDPAQATLDLSGYDEFFRCGPGARVYLEASPQYMDAGDLVAPRIRAMLPDVKLVFMLRDPVRRFLSHVRYEQLKSGRTAIGADVNRIVGEVVPIDHRPGAMAGPLSDRMMPESIRSGLYADGLQRFLDAVGADQMFIGFLERLETDPLGFMVELCGFLGISGRVFDGATFPVENRKRNVKHPSLNRTAERLTLRLEPFFNRLPVARRMARRVYHVVNPEVPEAASQRLTAETTARLEAYYRPSIESLRRLMVRHFPARALPPWVSCQSP